MILSTRELKNGDVIAYWFRSPISGQQIRKERSLSGDDDPMLKPPHYNLSEAGLISVARNREIVWPSQEEER